MFLRPLTTIGRLRSPDYCNQFNARNGLAHVQDAGRREDY